jgi:putative transposase
MRRFWPHILYHGAVIYRGFPLKMHYEIPGWVEPESLFHIRIALDRYQPQASLADPLLATALLQSAEFYDSKSRWHIALFLVMPDHIHAILAFPRDQSMSRVIGDWKRFHARTQKVFWQGRFFRPSITQRRTRGTTPGESRLHPAESGCRRLVCNCGGMALGDQ